MTKHASHHPTYTLHTSFPVRRVLWRPGYECELTIVSNADFGPGSDFGHAALSAGSTSGSGGLTSAVPSPRAHPSHLSETSATVSAAERAKSVTRHDGSDPVEIWDVRRGYIAKWVVMGSAVEGGVTGLSQLDYQCVEDSPTVLSRHRLCGLACAVGIAFLWDFLTARFTPGVSASRRDPPLRDLLEYHWVNSLCH